MNSYDSKEIRVLGNNEHYVNAEIDTDESTKQVYKQNQITPMLNSLMTHAMKIKDS